MIPSNKEVRCCDCGLRAEIDPSHFCPPGWEYLQLTGRVRCGTCKRDLESVNAREAAPMQRQDFQDTTFMPLDLTPGGEIEPTPAPPPPSFSAGGGGDFAGAGASASWEVAAAPADPPAPSPSPAPAPSVDSSSSSSDSAASASGD